MKNFFIKIGILCLFAYLQTSCGKDGAVGPEGNQGPQGEQGIQGANGKDGKDGTIVYSGISNPLSTIGKEGDFYINLTSKMLFGPKKSNIWGNGIALNGITGNDGKDGEKGETGANGKDGNTILNGKGVPLESLGNIGDFYFDTENILLYGAKLSSGWGNPINLVQNPKDGVRIIIKENLFFPIDDLKINHYMLDGSNLIKYNGTETKINIGDIENYNSNGAVLVQSRVNNGFWGYSSAITKQIGTASFYQSAFSNLDFDYDGNFLILPPYYSELYKFIGTKAEAINLFKSEFSKNKFDVKIILIPATSIEKLNKKFPDYKIDTQFLDTFYKVSNSF